MTKEEVIKQCNAVVDKLEDLMQNAEELMREIRGVVRAAEYLPSEPKDIDDGDSR